MIIYLSRDHSGKPDRPTDTGAGADIDQDGRIEIQEQEALWTPLYLWEAEVRLRELGHVVIPISDGRYSERHARVNAYAATFGAERQVYVAAHLNAGGGTYGSVFYHHRSSAGAALAASVAGALGRGCPELAIARAYACSSSAWSRAYSTISGVGSPVALCYEPAFLDTAAHRPLFSAEGMARIGRALAEGIHAWANTGGIA